jgi:hypothetical protein
VSPKRAVLPGKDLLFNQRAAAPVAEVEAPPPGPGGTGVSPVVSAPAATPVALEVVALEPPPVTVPEAGEDPTRHVQLCVWVDPAVAHEVDRARARLLMEEGVKVTKSQIVEALLRPGLADLTALVRLLNK